jgi:predicted kinase
MAREFLWKELGLVGNDTLRNLRESVCFLVKYHSFPPYAVLEENPLHKSLKIASNGELASLFTIEKLCALARADVYGRISKSNNEYLNRIEFLTLLAKEQGFYTTPFSFANAYTERGYFTGKTAWQNDVLYNNSYGEVIIVAGLPGTGKDTFIKNNYPTLPVVSLDEIRVRMGVLPTDNQGIVIQTAKEESKQYLRKKQSFVFNATNITYDVSSKYVSLFEEYHAFVKIVFLEVPYEVELLRNSGRENVVPVTAIDKMLSKLEMVERWESGDVCWF